jgi:hypothetical protein
MVKLNMVKAEMEKKAVEEELSLLLAKTLQWEDELNSFFRMDD